MYNIIKIYNDIHKGEPITRKKEYPCHQFNFDFYKEQGYSIQKLGCNRAILTNQANTITIYVEPK